MVVSKLTAAMVFGCDVKAVFYCFYVKEQVATEEVLRQTLLKLVVSCSLNGCTCSKTMLVRKRVPSF